MDSTLKIAGSDWQLQTSVEEQAVTNFELAREKRQHFHITMVEDTWELSRYLLSKIKNSGIPVIAGNQDGSATPLQNGEVGLLIDPDSIEEIARAIIKVLTGRAPKNLLDRDFLRRKTLEKFGLDRFPERVNEMLSLFLAK